MNKFQKTFDRFLAEEAENAIVQSTRARWRRSGYSVELFADGTYRLLWDKQISNLYVSSGVIIGIPQLADDEWNSEDESLSYFDNAIDELKEKFNLINE